MRRSLFYGKTKQTYRLQVLNLEATYPPGQLLGQAIQITTCLQDTPREHPSLFGQTIKFGDTAIHLIHHGALLFSG